MLPAASLVISPGMKKGDDRAWPAVLEMRFCVSSMGKPPMPEPTTTAKRSRLASVTGTPASSMAKWAAPIA